GTGATISGLTSPGPATRRFTFSTTTALLRPWLKLCRTTPCSTPPRLSVSVLVELTLSFSPVFLVVSVIRMSLAGSVRRSPHRPYCADRRPETVQGADSAPKRSRSQGRRAGLHVSHLGGSMPNPIAPRSGIQSQRGAGSLVVGALPRRACEHPRKKPRQRAKALRRPHVSAPPRIWRSPRQRDRPYRLRLGHRGRPFRAAARCELP